MDVNVISQFISTLGFPIVMCGAMFWYINKTDERHSAEVDKLRDTVERNTEVMNKLLIKLESDNDG